MSVIGIGGPVAGAVVLDAALNAHRGAQLAELLQGRRRIVRRVSQRLLGPIVGTVGADLAGVGGEVFAIGCLLTWALTQTRPDRLARLDAIDRGAWIDSTSWRPMLAVMCQAGFAPVPDFRDRYRRRADESVADNLCGLWAVGPSTFYRYLDKGKRLMLQALLDLPGNPDHALTLRRVAADAAIARLGVSGDDAVADWHRRRADDALARRSPVEALWHLAEAGERARFVAAVARHPTELAAAVETDALVGRLAGSALPPQLRVDLLLAMAALHRTRNADERERAAYEEALRLAGECGDRRLIGIAYGALGKFHEPRDADRAFACYEDSAEYLRNAVTDDPDAGDPAAVAPYLTTLVRLAWLHVLRNDPRGRAVLDRAEQLRSVAPSLPDDVLGMLEQTWGEYWRRVGQIGAALKHKHRALNIFERIGDQRSVLATYSNLSLLYGEAKDYDRAVSSAQRVLDLSSRIAVEPEIPLSAHLNQGVAHFWQGRYGEAIAAYSLALELSLSARLPLHQHRAHLNLAEAHYKRFQIGGDAQDERLGDAHAAAAMKANPAVAGPELIDAARNLKSEVLGAHTAPLSDRLLPQESAVHFDEMADIQRQRALLAVPVSVDAHVRAHLGIAAAYLAIAAKERDAARALVERHALGEQFGADFDRLRSTFERDRTLEDRLAVQWRAAAGDLIGDARRSALLTALLREGAINKSGYADLCGVALATASKHLVTLSERGLLRQTGKGPSTRYILPTD